MRKVVLAAYEHVDRMVKRADGSEGGGPWWFGWAVREAFIAGALWRGRAHRLRSAKLQHPTAAQKPNLESPWISYAQGNGLHVAVDSAGTVWTSKDGRQWTIRDG